MRSYSISRLAALAAVVALWTASPTSAQVRISEFLASSASTTTVDWIEIHNASNAPVNLDGWHLTDTPTNLARWTFPATNLPAGGFLLVYASGQDLAAPDLHANFSLAADGEYLALVRPDGTTIEHEYAPAFPRQFPDITYGIQTHGTNPTLRAGLPGYLIYRTPGSANSCLPAPHPLYSDDSVAQIDLAISNDDLDWLHWGNPDTTSFRSVNVRFRHGDIDLTVTNAGIQCRGNTSLTQYPRSFNVVFNAFVPGQKLLDLERLNLNADVNDPSMARPKIVNDLHHAAGLPTSYANHVALVVSNSTYHYSYFDAVRNNTQPIDDVFLRQRFGTDRGNLYKCLYMDGTPASLSYLGPTGTSYSAYSSTYALRYCGAGDASYNDLAALVSQINLTSDTDFPNTIMNVFEVDDFLQRLALDVLTGHWDDYWINGNNYHLFLNPETRRWTYLPYDFDNSFDIRWIDADWANQNIFAWTNISTSHPDAPLAARLMAVPEFKKRYAFYMKRILDTTFSTSSVGDLAFFCRTNLVDSLPFQNDVSVSNMKSAERSNYGGNWPYWSLEHFNWSYLAGQYYTGVPDARGILPFVSARVSSAYSQLGTVSNIAPILSDFALTPSLPRTNDAVAVSIAAFDDVAVTNVAFFYTFNGGATQTVALALQADGSYAAALPAFGATGTVRYLVRALDDTAKATFHPYGGAAYAASVEIGSAAFDLVVSEINYNPAALTPAESAAGITDAQNLEFVELYNAGNAPLDITGFQLQLGITATFPAFTLTNGTYAVVVKDTNQFRLRYTNSAIRIIGTFAGNLSNGGEILRLDNASGGVIASIAYSDSGAWPGRADGDGSSLELADPAFPAYADPAAWRSSSEYGGTPGAAGLGPDNRIVVNEVLTHTDPPLSDSIELFNTTAGAIDIGGWFLSDSKSNYRKYRIPADTILPAGGYVAFNETNHFNTSLGVDTNDFSLNGAHGDNVYLLETDARTNLVRFVDRVEFGAAANGESFGRWPNGSGRGVPMLNRTFGSANSGPRIGPLVISELMVNPPSGSNHLEFIEIANPTALPVDLTRWQLDSGIAFAFPTNTTLPAGDALVVVSFDPNAPSNSALLADFRATYGISTNVPLVGPYSGALANTGEDIRLLRPDEPPLEEPGYYPMLIEDDFAYDTDAPWPVAANGGGASLERLLPAAWGDDATSWIAADPPTPGTSTDPIPTFTLTVVSAHGSPVPSVGTHAIATNAALSNSVPSPVVSGGFRFLCTGWTLASNAPASGATNWMLMTLTNHATLAWNWDTNFSLSVAAGPGGSVLPGNGWHPVGATVELQATASNDFAFAGWTGTTNAIVAGSATSATISVQLAAPVSLTAQFDAVTPTYYVSPAGSNLPPYTTWATAATSLQAIVDYVPSASTILVAAATYPLTSQLSISRPLLLKSQDGPATTFLDGGNSTRVLFLSHADATVEGFTLQNGNSGSSSGGGVRIEPAGALVNSIIRSNTTQKSGGGATLLGGGELRNCLLYGNSANSERGGGVYAYTESGTPLVENCTLSANSANEGGGAYLLNAATLRNSITWENSASWGSNIILSGFGHTLQANLTNASPQFVAAASANFRLATNSPCIDAATNQPWMANATDLDGRPRLIHDRADIGAFEAILPAWDSDADGLPDEWEWEHSQSLTGMDPAAHSDSDRLTDYQEFLAGTDPFDGGSNLDIDSSRKGSVLTNTFVMGWSSATGRSYRIAFSTNMVTPFSFIAYSNIPADPPANSFTGSLHPHGAGYYRIELED
jgi:hypothetical protein